jgi:anti-sigma regulatory factor (Ser/Thr protein kinase)
LSGCRHARRGVRSRRQALASDMVIKSSLNELSKVKRATREAVVAVGLGPREAFDVVLAVHEAVANAIVHGNGSRAERSVTVGYICRDDRITVRVRDEGPGFDVDAALARLQQPPSLEDLSGRGLLLMTRLMDELAWNAEGNEVSLTKYTGRMAAAAQPAERLGPLGAALTLPPEDHLPADYGQDRARLVEPGEGQREDVVR